MNDRGYRLSCIAGFVFAVLTAVGMLGGCAGINIQAGLQQSLARGDCAAAQSLIENSRSQYGANAELLYLLDGAMVSLQCRDYPMAQERLHAAEDLAEKLWTESIIRHAAALVTSDYSLEYAGEDYERVMIHLVSAIGYLQAGQLDEALVEVRRLDSLLGMYAAEFKEEQFYKIDAFARYLSGMIREADGEFDGAFIDYYQAVEAYQNQQSVYGIGLPDMLAVDLWRLASRVGRAGDAQRLIPEAGHAGDPTIDPDPEAARIVLIVFSGEGPQKIQDTVILPSRRGPISIAFPRIVSGPASCLGGHLQLTGATGHTGAGLSLVSDINAIAVQSLDEKKGRIIAKAFARAVAKQAVIQGIASTQKEAKDQAAVSVALNLMNVLALEKADLRSWRTLPGHILMTRMFVKPGTYSGRLSWCQGRAFDLDTVTVAAGKTRFLFLDARYGNIGSGQGLN